MGCKETASCDVAGGEGEMLDSAPSLDMWGPAAGSKRKQASKLVVDLVTSSSSEPGTSEYMCLSCEADTCQRPLKQHPSLWRLLLSCGFKHDLL